MSIKLSEDQVSFRRHSYPPNAEINVTPFVDVILVLLVIYAISYGVMLVIYFIGLIVFSGVMLAGSADLSAHHTTPFGYVGIGLLILAAAVIIVFWSALLMAAYSASFAVLYRDQCLRRDGPEPFPDSNPGAFPAGAL